MDASEFLSASAVVPVVVIEEADSAVGLALTLAEAGLSIVEVTLRTPVALAAIERIANEVPAVTIGAGSVRHATQMSEIVSAGAQFAVSPGFSDGLLRAAADHELPFVPGAVTPSESLQLLECGYKLQKFFPAELAGGMAMLNAVAAPIPEVRFFPTGGITAESAADYLAMQNVACVGGSWVAPVPLLRKRDFGAIGGLARDAANLTL